MKKFLSCCLAIAFMVLFCACAGKNAISVSFMDLTGANSTDFTVLVQYAEEKDYEDYHTELMIKVNKPNITLQIRKELEDFVTISIGDANQYKSLTALLCVAQNEVGQETYVNYKQTVNTTWIIRCSEDVEVSLKAVVGTCQDNAYGGQLLTDKIDISKEFLLNVKKYQK